MQPKLIALDVDGTILDSSHQLRRRTKQAIAQAQAAGVLVTLATGRRLRVTLPIARLAGIDAPLVVNNGNRIYDPASGAFPHREPLPDDTAAAAIRLARDRDIATILYRHTDSGPDMFCERESHDPWFLWLEGRSPDCLLVPDLQAVTAPLTDKLVFHGSALEIADLTAAFQAGLPGAWRTYYGCDPDDNATLELFHASCSKADGVRRLAASLGIAAGEVMAMGDGSNDMEILQWAGIGVAMGNAPEAVQAAAAHVTATNDEDGVALAIERFVLGSA